MPVKYVLPAFIPALTFALHIASALHAEEPPATTVAKEPPVIIDAELPGKAPVANRGAAGKATPVIIEFTVLEVDVNKLRAVGFDWDLISSGGKPSPDLACPLSCKLATGQRLEGFLKALTQYNLAKVLSNPTLTTLSGRPASIAVGDQLKLDVVPIVLGSGRIRVEHRLELSAAKLKSDSTSELDPGQVAVVSKVRSEHKDALGKVRETETLVLVRADLAEKSTTAIGNTAAVPLTEPARR